jgi:uncharacterized membrane protein YphA (DoxX/SURF4 family)
MNKTCIGARNQSGVGGFPRSVTPCRAALTLATNTLFVMFVFTATAHFNKMKHDPARMIPAYLPHPVLLVYVTGVLELLGAAGLVLPAFRRVAGICLIALLVGMVVNTDLTAGVGSCRFWFSRNIAGRDDKKWHRCEYNNHEVVDRP